MYKRLGELIVKERKARGWDQAQLAARMGNSVRQQAISGWERGISRPRKAMLRNIAEVLRIDIELINELAGYGRERIAQQKTLQQHLKLDELTPDHFEIFLADLVSLLHPHLTVHRQGSQGHRQEGYDILAIDSRSQVKIGLQVKRVKNFGPEKVKMAVEAALIATKKSVICLSRVSTPSARTEIRNHQNWEIWDVDDISRRVRQLPKDRAVRLLDTHIPGARESFLGVPEPSPWQTREDYFGGFSDKIYSHERALVGRQGELKNAEEFFSSGKEVLLVSGRGGIGKTRLVGEIAKKSENNYAFRFLVNGAPVSPQQFELLPIQEPLCVVIEDAHDRADTAQLLASISQLNREAKFILVARPYGRELLNASLRKAGIHHEEVQQVNIADLTFEESLCIAKDACKGVNSPLIRRLALLGKDCPLLCVVGGGLIKRGLLKQSKPESDDLLQEEILKAFKDTYVSGDQLALKILEAVSILQPVRLKEESFMISLQAMAGTDKRTVIAKLQNLEDRGILMNRAESLRIVPDLLGDVILRQACVDERYTGQSTGFLENAIPTLSGTAFVNAFVNGCRLDWLTNPALDCGGLTDSLWKQLEDGIQNSSNQERIGYVATISRVAHYNSAAALSILKKVITEPSAAEEEGSFAGFRPLTHSNVLSEVAPVLKNIAYHPIFCRECADLLWDISANDARALNTFYNHPVRLLQDLASYDLDKSLIYTEILLEAAEGWLESGSDDDLFSPFDVIEGVFATEGHSDHATGHSIQMTSYAVSPAAVSNLRTRAIRIALKEAKGSSTRRAIRAIDALSRGVGLPTGLLGRDISLEEKRSWYKAIVEVMNAMAEVATCASVDPLVQIRIRTALEWQATWGEAEPKKVANGILKRLTRSGLSALATGLYDGWGHVELRRRARAADVDYGALRQNWLKDSKALIDSALSPEEVIEHSEKRLQIQSTALRKQASPGPFMAFLMQEDHSLIDILIRSVKERPLSPLIILLPVALSLLADFEPEIFIKEANELFGLAVPGIQIAVAQAVGFNRGHRDLVPGEMVLLQKLAMDPSPAVRENVVQTAQRLCHSHAAETVQLLSLIEFRDSKGLAEEVVNTFSDNFSWDSIPDYLRKHILTELEACPEIDHWSFANFLNSAALVDPDSIVGMLKRRVERSEVDYTSEFTPIPYFELHFSFDSQTRRRLMSDLLSWLGAPVESWRRRHFGAELFRAVVGSYDEDVIHFFEETLWTASKSTAIAVCRALKEAPRTLIWDRPQFVSLVLNTAARFDDEALKIANGALYSCGISGVRSGPAGQPFPEDLQQRDMSRQIAEQFADGSLERQLYMALYDSADSKLKRHELEVALVDDRREW